MIIPFIKKHWASLLWSVILAFLMLMPQDAFPDSKIFTYDKLGHLGVYAILSIIILYERKTKGKYSASGTKNYIYGLTISVVYGVVLELLQYFVPGRMTDIYDLAANTLGAIVGVVVFSTFIKN